MKYIDEYVDCVSAKCQVAIPDSLDGNESLTRDTAIMRVDRPMYISTNGWVLYIHGEFTFIPGRDGYDTAIGPI